MGEGEQRGRVEGTDYRRGRGWRGGGRGGEEGRRFDVGIGRDGWHLVIYLTPHGFYESIFYA